MAMSYFFLVHALIVLCATTYYIFSPGAESATGSGFFFDAYIFIGFFYYCYRLRIAITPIAVISSSVLIVILVVEYIVWKNSGGHNIIEFIKSIRFAVYMIMFAFTGEMISVSQYYRVSIKPLSTLVVFMCVMFLAAYSIQLFVLGDDRPRLYAENNFEIPALLCFLAISLHVALSVNNYSRQAKLFRIFSLLIPVLSLSKSGILEGFFVYARNFKMRGRIWPISIIFSVAAIGLISTYVYLTRLSNGITGIDRFLFLKVFISEFSSGTIINYFLGFGAATELSPDACSTLSFWSKVMFGSDADCTAAVFHSFFMKVTYEYGIVGFCATNIFWLYFLRKFFGAKLGLNLFSIVAISSLSVSGFSNSIIIWPYFVCLTFGKATANRLRYAIHDVDTNKTIQY